MLRVGGLRHPLPAVQAGGGVPPRPRPGARRRRPLVGVLMRRPARVQAARPRRGPHRGRDPVSGWSPSATRSTVNQPLVRGGDGEGRGRDPGAVGRHGHRAAVRGRDDGRGRRADHHDRHRRRGPAAAGARGRPAPPPSPPAGLIGGPAPGGRTAGAGRLRPAQHRGPPPSAPQRRRRGRPATAPPAVPEADYGSGSDRPPLLATAPDATVKPVRHGGLETGRAAEAHVPPPTPRRRRPAAHRSRRLAPAGQAAGAQVRQGPRRRPGHADRHRRRRRRSPAPTSTPRSPPRRRRLRRTEPGRFGAEARRARAADPDQGRRASSPPRAWWPARSPRRTSPSSSPST